MTLAERLEKYVRACFPCIWIQSQEESEVLREVAELCRDRGWPFASWDIDRGLLVAGQAADIAQAAGADADPIAAIRSLSALARPESAALLVLKNFHRFLGSAEVVQVLAHQIERGKEERSFLFDCEICPSTMGDGSSAILPEYDMLESKLTMTQSPFWWEPGVTDLIARARNDRVSRSHLAELVYRPAFKRIDTWLAAAGFKQLNMQGEDIFDALWARDLATAIDHVAFQNREHFL